MTNLLTERLTLRPYTETDFEAFTKMHEDPAIESQYPCQGHESIAGAGSFRWLSGDLCQGWLRHAERSPDGWRSDVGECGLWFREDAGGYTLRYTIRKMHWNLGYSIEAVRAVLDDAFNAQGLDKVQAIAMNHNIRSVKVLERAGFLQTESNFRDVAGFLRFELTKVRWLHQAA